MIWALNVQRVKIEKIAAGTASNPQAVQEYHSALNRCTHGNNKLADVAYLSEYTPHEVTLRGLHFLDAFVRVSASQAQEWSLFLVSYRVYRAYKYLADLRCSFKGSEVLMPLTLVAETKSYGGEGVLTCQIPNSVIQRHKSKTLAVRMISGSGIEMIICAVVVPTGGRRHKHTLSNMIRNEASALPEWIEHHRLVGFQHFYIYDNGSTDETLDVLRRYVDAGIVTLVHWNYQLGGPDNNREQRVQINHALWMFGPDVEWMAL